jgi:hypothetical protein
VVQAALSEDATVSPYRVRSVLRVQVSVAAVELQGANGMLLMQASMGGVDTRTVLYPQTQDIAFSVSTVRRHTCKASVQACLPSSCEAVLPALQGTLDCVRSSVTCIV